MSKLEQVPTSDISPDNKKEIQKKKEAELFAKLEAELGVEISADQEARITEMIGKIYEEEDGGPRAIEDPSAKKPGLDYYDNKIDQGSNYEGKFGKWDKD